jgi:hypothetical protein
MYWQCAVNTELPLLIINYSLINLFKRGIELHLHLIFFSLHRSVTLYELTAPSFDTSIG